MAVGVAGQRPSRRQMTALVHRLLQGGGDADRQRAALAGDGLPARTGLIIGWSPMA
ncbi:hypothetical protein [Streptomyces sp. NBC_00582]|uniref:hypothetical protein n=1 Tax=Streptomyces sp. NBC_00582 TaxID=2975783 RepID=UPI0010E83641|nr:hypothetical protein [Streptomyces sp. NBC_00582]WUB67254.1 hypothetical protein OG852_46070 [Streptomyces sp. NBC_00582]